jgi:hypothetical protein
MARTRLLNTRRPLSERPKHTNHSQTPPPRNPHNRIMMKRSRYLYRRKKLRFTINNIIVVPRIMRNQIAIF